MICVAKGHRPSRSTISYGQLKVFCSPGARRENLESRTNLRTHVSLLLCYSPNSLGHANPQQLFRAAFDTSGRANQTEHSTESVQKITSKQALSPYPALPIPHLSVLPCHPLLGHLPKLRVHAPRATHEDADVRPLNRSGRVATEQHQPVGLVPEVS